MTVSSGHICISSLQVLGSSLSMVAFSLESSTSVVQDLAEIKHYSRREVHSTSPTRLAHATDSA